MYTYIISYISYMTFIYLPIFYLPIDLLSLHDTFPHSSVLVTACL